MQPLIRSLHSPDVTSLEAFLPDDPESFGFLLQLMIGAEGSDGEESFDLQVCTPRWLLENAGSRRPMLGLHRLIVFEYDFRELRSYLERLVARCSADDWNGVAAKLSRFARWEFEDYQDVTTP